MERNIGFKEDWKAVKKTIEDATGKKKPTKKFILAFRASANLEKKFLKVAEKAAIPLYAEATSRTPVELFLDNLKG